MSEHVGGRVMVVDVRRKSCVLALYSFSTIGRAHLVHRGPAVQAYRGREKHRKRNVYRSSGQPL